MSPYKFRQEMYRDEPWKMLVICMMLNRTTAKQVDSVRFEFFDRYPTPEALVVADEESLTKLLRPLGLYNRRASTLKKFAEAWNRGGWKRVSELPGVGKYAEDSWLIFQEGKINIEPDDKELKKYVKWARAQKHSK